MAQREMLVSPVVVREIEATLKIIGDQTALGVNGFGSKLFKQAWQIMRGDVIKVVMYFFKEGKLDKRFKRTLVTLIPKKENAKSIRDFRPISCCTIVYKIISKIMSNRMGKVLNYIVSRNQTAFVHGQKIQDHVLLAYKLIQGYKRKSGMPRCMLQMDTQKAYDSFEWHALKSILEELGFLRKFIFGIMQVVTSITYQFNVNGTYRDRMKARRGLRQGGPFPLCFS